MFTLFLLGNIASGKSTAARYFAQRGAMHIDLDMLAKELYQPPSPLLADLAHTFGADILDSSGGLVRELLASRAFATPAATAQLNALVHPRLSRELRDRLAAAHAHTPPFSLAMVEVSAPSEFAEVFELADSVLAITASYETRRLRAYARGMSSKDFERRAAVQPSEETLCAMADTVIENIGDTLALFAALDAYLAAHHISLKEAPDHA